MTLTHQHADHGGSKYRRHKLAYGLTTTTQQRFAQQLSEQLNIPAEEIERAMDAVTRIELLRVSRNENPAAHMEI